MNSTSQTDVRDVLPRLGSGAGALVLSLFPGIGLLDRAFEEFCRLQGLPVDFLADAPFSSEGKYRMVGNGVPLPMGRTVARAVRQAINDGGSK